MYIWLIECIKHVSFTLCVLITFTHTLGTFAYKVFPLGFCNVSPTFQQFLDIFSILIHEYVEVYMNDFTVYGNTFEEVITNLLITRTLDLHNLMPLAWIFNDIIRPLTNLVNKALRILKK